MYFFSSRRRHTRWPRDWSSDVCSSDLKKSVHPLQSQNSHVSTPTRSSSLPFSEKPDGCLSRESISPLQPAPSRLFHQLQSAAATPVHPSHEPSSVSNEHMRLLIFCERRYSLN